MSDAPTTIQLAQTAGRGTHCVERFVSPSVAVLFARKDSIYKSIPGCEVYDSDRDALTYAGGMPVVAHPPCRTWGSMSHMTHVTKDETERNLALWALEQVRQWGGVLEHPARSKLWKQIPKDDRGWLMPVNQIWWGHVASKPTRLYICGILRAELPSYPLTLHLPRKTVAGIRGKPGMRCTQYEREYTPGAFAEWLIAVARLCGANT